MLQRPVWTGPANPNRDGRVERQDRDNPQRPRGVEAFTVTTVGVRGGLRL